FVKVEKWVNFGCFLQCSRELGPFYQKTVGAIELDAKRRFQRGAGRWETLPGRCSSMGLRKVENWTNYGCFLQCSRELGPLFRKTVCTIELDAKRRFRRGTGRWGWKKLIFFYFFYSVKTLVIFFSALMRVGRICTRRFGVQE
ncbi:Trifunctional enzyme subunit beta, mitochondrial, partial [Frankliniella fusca]